MHAARHRGPSSWGAGAWSDLVCLLLPTACPGCGLPDVPLCGACRASLLGAPHPAGPLSVPGAPAVWCVGAYAGELRHVLLAWKDGGRHDLAPVVAGALTTLVGDALRREAARPLLLVPAPSGRAAVRRRGADLLAQATTRAATSWRRRGARVSVAPVLRQGRGVVDQAGLSTSARWGNVEGSFRVSRSARVRGRACLLVDDVVTTGATLAEGRRVLEAAGADVVGAVAVAATPRLVVPPGARSVDKR